MEINDATISLKLLFAPDVSGEHESITFVVTAGQE